MAQLIDLILSIKSNTSVPYCANPSLNPRKNGEKSTSKHDQIQNIKSTVTFTKFITEKKTNFVNKSIGIEKENSHTYRFVATRRCRKSIGYFFEEFASRQIRN